MRSKPHQSHSSLLHARVVLVPTYKHTPTHAVLNLIHIVTPVQSWLGQQPLESRKDTKTFFLPQRAQLSIYVALCSSTTQLGVLSCYL